MAHLTEMSRALSTGVRLLSLLDGSIKSNGGPEEALYLLATDAGKENLDRVGAFIAQLEWQYPMSKIMQLARARCVSEYDEDPEVWDNDELFFWEPILQELKIPYVRFVGLEDEPNGLNEDDHLLRELKDQLQGVIAAPGLVINWKDEQYVVGGVGIDASGPAPGELLDVDKMRFVHLVSTRYIDVTT